MEMITERLKFIDEYPEEAGKLAKRLKRKKDEIEFIRKFYVADKQEVKKKERAVISYISTGTKDRDNEQLLSDGVVLENYRKNPVVLWAHMYRDLPIGKNIWVKKDDRGLIAKTVFAKNEKADEIFKAYTEDIDGTGPLLKAWSVGFIPIEYDEIEAKGKKEEPERVYKKWELLEYSAVPIPSCPEALTLAIDKGIVKSKQLKKDLEIELIKDKEIEIELERNGKTKEKEIELEKDVITKPETTENYHRIPVESPDKHKGHRIRTITISASQGIKALYCGTCKKVITYLFSTSKWSMDEAQAWVREHKDLDIALYVTEEETIGDLTEKILTGEKQEKFKCECIKCGHKLTSEKHCNEIKCPECGGEMRRVERPGPGRAIEQTNELVEYLNLENAIKDLTEQVAELKEGRVLSTKNRTLVKKTIDSLTEVKYLLEELYNATEPPAREEEGKEYIIERSKKAELSIDEKIAQAINKVTSEKLGGMIKNSIEESVKTTLSKLRGKVE